MKHVLLFFLFNLGSLFLFSQEIPQQLVSSAGDDFQTGDISFSFSLGECMVETYYTPYVIYSQGLLQLSKNSRVPVKPNPSIVLAIHPNPAREIIWLDISKELENLEQLSIEVYDLSGYLLHRQNITNYHQKVDLSAFYRHTLLIQIKQNKQVIYTKTIQRVY